MTIKPYQSNNIVVLRNPIAMSKYKLSLMQQKVFIEVACYLKNNPTERTCPVIVREFYQRIGIVTNDNNELYAQMKQMLGMVIHIPNTRKKGNVQYADAPMFASVKVIVDSFNRAIIEIEISDVLKPYFIEIAEGDFFSYKIENTRKLKSSQSIKLYMYLRSWSRLGKHTIYYNELRDILNIDSDDYKVFGDFKRRVLDKAQTEIHKKTDLYFDYSLIRAVPSNPNTPVEKISFVIKGETTQIQIPLVVEPDKELLHIAHQIEQIPILELSAIIGQYGRERVYDVLVLAGEQIAKGIKITSLIGFLHTAIKNGSGKGKRIAQVSKKQQAQAIVEHRAIETAINRGIDEYKTRLYNDIGKHAPQHEKELFFAKVNEDMRDYPALKSVWQIKDEWNLDALREGLGAKLNTLTDEELACMMFKIERVEGLWKYKA